MKRYPLLAACMLALGAFAWSGSPSRGTPALTQQPDKTKCTLFGRLTDEAGKPVAGAKIQLYGGFATRSIGQSAVTDGDGRYRFDPLETGAGRPGLLAPGMRIEHREMVAGDGQTWWDIDVPTGKSVEKNFAMVRGGNISGTLKFGSGDWTLREFDVRIISADQKRTWYAKTDNGGSFTTEALFPGEYIVQANDGRMNYPEIVTLTVVAAGTASFKARCLFSMRAERLE